GVSRGRRRPGAEENAGQKEGATGQRIGPGKESSAHRNTSRSRFGENGGAARRAQRSFPLYSEMRSTATCGASRPFFPGAGNPHRGAACVPTFRGLRLQYL